MALPDFMIIGAPKAGSTALHAALVQHPQVFMCTPKEPKFFMTDGRPRRRDHRGPGDAHSAREWMWRRSEYEALFAAARPGTVRGEASPFYLWDRAAHRRMAALVPDAKLIAVVRDPVDRAYSNWTHLRADGLEPVPDFRAACDQEEPRAAAGWAPFWRYVGLGRYGEQLAHLREYYPPEQIYVLRYAELVDTPRETLHRICAFLGVDPLVDELPPSNLSAWSRPTRLNSGLSRVIRAGAAAGAFAPPGVWRRAEAPLRQLLHRGAGRRPPLPAPVRRELIGRFADDISVLEQLVGRSFDSWRDDSDRGGFAARTTSTDTEGVATWRRF